MWIFNPEQPSILSGPLLPSHSPTLVVRHCPKTRQFQGHPWLRYKVVGICWSHGGYFVSIYRRWSHGGFWRVYRIRECFNFDLRVIVVSLAFLAHGERLY